MSDGSSFRLLSIPAAAADRLPNGTVADAISYFSPDAVVLPGGRNARGYATVRSAAEGIPTIHPQLGRNGERVARYTVGPEEIRQRSESAGPPIEASGPDLLAVQSGAVLVDLAGEALDDGPAATYLFVPDLSVESDPTALTADLPHADEIAAIARAFSGDLVVLAGGQPAGYRHVWDLRDGAESVESPVVGLGATGEGTPAFGEVVCTADGTTATEAIPADKFGLQALDGVGRATADRLVGFGCPTRDGVRDTAASDLAELSGVGRTRAERLHAHADVIETGEPLVLTNETPIRTRDGRPPLCLDIETDGLSPTIIWQIGVYDPATDTHRAFVERSDPTDPAAVLGSFLEWLLGTHAERTLLTWNGDRFDYPQIARFLRRYHPHYLEAWEDMWTDDLYGWAVREGNALLPGRTNRLDDVAAALGYERAGTGLSGARTAAAYRRFMQAPDDPEAEPDWERHERYCRDDCEALWHVYESIDSAERRDVTDSGSGGAAGRQSGLTEF